MNMEMKLDHTTLQEKVTAALRKMILLRKFTPGERLIQEELAESLGVSRMPIREALQRLEIEGLIEIIPHKGAVVKEISKEDIEEIYFLRSLLEGLAVQKSLNHLSKEDISCLEDLVEKMEEDIREDNLDGFVEHNILFHQLLRKGCNWKRIDKMIQYLWNGYPPYVPSLLPKTMKTSNEEHRQMLKAIQEKDPVKLRYLMEKHVMRAGEALLSIFEI
ncbi:GntR family transcriptional regulator [Geobacillus thermoleovorans]|uniref:GntR family transcriptional regulator n=1 Tax=Geobacillus thermoleovorans TaxID=33941 RepID=UPI003D1DD809